MAAAKSLGRRISHKIRPAGESASILLKAAAISAADSLTLPNMAFNSKRRIQPKSRKEKYQDCPEGACFYFSLYRQVRPLGSSSVKIR